MNKNIDFEQIQFQINDLAQQRNSLIMKVEKMNREIAQINLDISWLEKDRHIHQLVRSDTPVYENGKDEGELICFDYWYCNQCNYYELREVE